MNLFSCDGIVAISDPADHAAFEYLIRFDTIFRPFPDELSIKEGHLHVPGRQISMFTEAHAGEVAWGQSHRPPGGLLTWPR